MQVIFFIMSVSGMISFYIMPVTQNLKFTTFCLQDMPGAPGMQMYSREDLMNQRFGGEDADEDDDDDEGSFPSKVVRTYE